MIGTRTRPINQMRAFCLEYGVALRQGAGLFKLDLPEALKDPANDLSPAMRKLLGNLFKICVSWKSGLLMSHARSKRLLIERMLHDG
jgi:hypothetical protein